MEQLDKLSESPVPFQFCWGTFCRQVVQEQDSEERSLINVLTGLKIALPKNALAEAEKMKPGQDLLLPIGQLYAFAVFGLQAPEYTNAEFDLEVRLAFIGLFQSIMVKLKFPSTSDYTQLAVKLPMVQVQIRPSHVEQTLIQRVSFHWKGYEVGQINLPSYIQLK